MTGIVVTENMCAVMRDSFALDLVEHPELARCSYRTDTVNLLLRNNLLSWDRRLSGDSSFMSDGTLACDAFLTGLRIVSPMIGGIGGTAVRFSVGHRLLLVGGGVDGRIVRPIQAWRVEKPVFVRAGTPMSLMLDAGEEPSSFAGELAVSITVFGYEFVSTQNHDTYPVIEAAVREGIVKVFQ